MNRWLGDCGNTPLKLIAREGKVMKPAQQETVILRLQFSDPRLAQPALEKLGRDRDLSVNIQRGRLTLVDASYELRITGSMKKIKNVIQGSGTWGASIGAFSVGLR